MTDSQDVTFFLKVAKRTFAKAEREDKSSLAAIGLRKLGEEYIRIASTYEDQQRTVAVAATTSLAPRLPRPSLTLAAWQTSRKRRR